jgi:hypothetical protein
MDYRYAMRNDVTDMQCVNIDFIESVMTLRIWNL